MKDDLNANPPDSPFPGHSGDALTRALEQMAREAAGTKDAAFVRAEAGACPDVNEWLRLAAGEATPQEQERLLAHAALCSACLARLRECQGLVSREFSAEEIHGFSQFAVATPAWRHRAAVELARTPHRAGRGVRLRLFAWATGAAAALAVALAATIWWQHDHAPENLLAQAYAQDRIFELRIPGAKFAPVTPAEHLRGPEGDVDPPQLLAALARIERQLQRAPNDAHWLQLQARAEVLEEHYDAAIDTLDRLVAAGPVTAGLLADDGMAYFLRGLATGSQNDRATALDTLRRADELAPGDPVLLFNEAVVMEDRGQVMNAVETWNRYLNFERDPAWRAEGQRRLTALEAKLNRLKTHQSRIEQHLSTPGSMRALAADPITVAGIDEELSTIMLPQLLNIAYPMPPDRSRGSPCTDRCMAARSLLHALAASLQRNHQDFWLSSFLPPGSDSNPSFAAAAHALGSAIDADTRGDYANATQPAIVAQGLFHQLHNTAGEQRAIVERGFALQRVFNFAACHQTVARDLSVPRQFTWIHAQAVAVDSSCATGIGTASGDNPLKAQALRMAQEARYPLLELRARNLVTSSAVESGDTEDAWRFTTETLRLFYQGDYPPFRAATVYAGLAQMEESTPRVHLALLLHRETCDVLAFTGNRGMQASEKSSLVLAALRAGSLQEAQSLLTTRAPVCGAPHDVKPAANLTAETQIMMADLYLDRGDPTRAAQALDTAHAVMAGMNNPFLERRYAASRGALDLALGHLDEAELLLRESILKEELEARGAGEENVLFARQNRDLYATLAEVWLAQHRTAAATLALWERYRLRILGQPVPACPDNGLDCLAPELAEARRRRLTGKDAALLGQIVLRDRVLLYRMDAQGVAWRQARLEQADVLAAAAALARAASSPATSQASVEHAAHRLGGIFFDGLHAVPAATLLLEPDPLLGNVPWAAVTTADGPIGLRFAMQETPSILMNPSQRSPEIPHNATDGMLVVGASVTHDANGPLPEVLDEARLVSSIAGDAAPLLAAQATEPRIAARLSSASLIHFAGHAAQFDGETRLLLAPSSATDRKAYLDRSLFLRYPPRDAQLIVFSACSTGKREMGWDHGMGDIVDTLASLGVPEVVATRWQIDSASAAVLMDAFYRGLAGGSSVPQALSTARQTLARDPRYSHPYYWAAYYADGVGSADLREVFHGGKR
jgi:CHAT domain-containing protein